MTAEKNPRRRAQEGSHRLRVITHGLDEEDRLLRHVWSELDAFCAEAFTVAARVLGLSDEQPVMIA